MRITNKITNKITRALGVLLVAFVLVCAPLPAAALPFAPPTATSFTAAVAVSSQTVIQLQGADIDGTPLTFATTSTPANATLSNLNTATGVVVFTPTAGWTGTTSFTYTVTSGGETSAAATVTVTVTAAKTRIIDTLLNPDGTPRKGKVTFILTQAATAPAGIMPAGASVSAQLDATGKFDVSVFPSRTLSPQQYYQVWFEDSSSLNRQLLGVYDIPATTVTALTLAPYRVTDTNLAARYTFPSEAAVRVLSESVSAATLSALTSAQVVAALGFTPENPALLQGLSAYWTMDEASGSRRDQVGGNSLQPTAVTLAAGKIGGAASFPSTGGRQLYAPDSGSLSAGSSGITLAGWFYPRSASVAAIASKWSGAGFREYLVQHSGGVLTFYASADGTNFTSVSTAASSVQQNAWNHFLAWHDAGAGTLNVKINNGATASAAFTGPILNTATGFMVGRHQDTGSNYFHGEIDALGIWQRALTAGEAAALYDGGAGVQLSPAPASSAEMAYNIRRDFNASGDDRTTTGTINAGSKSLVVTSDLGFKVGHGILVEGAAAGGSDLVTKVDAVSGLTLTLEAAATLSVAGVLVQHDDTQAIQNSIDQCHAIGGCVVDWPSGGYNVEGPVSGTNNNILNIPTTGTASWTIKWRGAFVSRNSETGQPTSGVRLISRRRTGTGTYPSILSVGPFTDTAPGPAVYPATIIVENFYTIGRTNPQLSMFNFNNAASAQVRDTFFVTGEMDPTTEPTNPQATALIMPGINNRVLLAVERTSVFGYYNGYRVSEGTRFNDTYAYRTKRAYVIAQTGGELSGTLGAAHCPTVIDFESSARVNFHLTVERWDTPGSWWSGVPSGDIVRASTSYVPAGVIVYALNIAGVGASSGDLTTNFTLGGAAALNMIKLATGDSTKWANRP